MSDAANRQTEIAVIEDDPEIARLLAATLREHGYGVHCFSQARDFLAAAGRRWDLCLLDLGLPDRDGMGLLPELSDKRRVPVIVISARQDRADVISSLELGADDYVIKPFDPREVVARIRSVLRRSAQRLEETDLHIARFGDLVFDLHTGNLTGPDGGAQRLTHAEATLLAAFLKSNGRILSREYLISQLGTEDAFDRAIDVRISRLRKKLSGDTATDPIQTVYGAGYVLAVKVEWIGSG